MNFEEAGEWAAAQLSRARPRLDQQTIITYISWLTFFLLLGQLQQIAAAFNRLMHRLWDVAQYLGANAYQAALFVVIVKTYAHNFSAQ